MKKIIAISALAVTITGCSETFNAIDYEPDFYDSHQYEGSYDKVPVLLAMNNPYFISVTRGAGAITPERDWVKKELTYYVYSFLTNNYAYTGEIDYSQQFSETTDDNSDVPVQCLMDDPRTGRGVAYSLLENEMLDLEEKGYELEQHNKDIKYYYSQVHQDYKYKFFAYAIDDAKVTNVMRNRENVQIDIEIDGTQDVITAVASPTEQQISSINPESDKWLYNNVLNGELVYSTLTGHRGIFPIFKAKHNLSRFVFNIVGEDALCDKIFIEEIYVMANKKWRFTVAADDENTLGLFIPEGNRERLEKVILQEMTVEGDPSTVSPIKKGVYNVGENERIDNIGMGLLLPPRDSYDLYVRCRYPSKDSYGNDVNRYYTARYALNHRTMGADGNFNTQPFVAGGEYQVTMHIYGYQPIHLSIGGFAWSEPVEIILDEENINAFE